MTKLIFLNLIFYLTVIQSNFHVHGNDITCADHFTDNTIKNTFPKNFIFGVSTSAYQIEGAWNVNHKGESIWDTMTHERPDKIADGSNGDIADNSYYLYKTDIDLVKQLGASAYRISISWTRILPNGTSNYINKDGIDYYNNVINEMLDRNITPYVTIFHWDLPQKLQDLGGWTNPKIVDWFVDYARVLFQEFGDRVSTVGIVVAMMVEVPENASDPEELAGSKFSWDFWNGWIINPIFSNDGDYPKAMKDRIAEYSAIQGFSKSRLPEFNPEQIQLVKNSADYFGFNFYSAFYIEKMKNYDIRSSVSRDRDVGMTMSLKKFPKDRNTPWAMAESLKRINENYNIPYFLITENGYWDKGTLYDTDRAQYYLDHLQVVSNLINQGLDIRGYFAWSLLDNFEWWQAIQSNFHVHGNDITCENNFTNKISENTFPDDFIFGVGSSAYQIEGAWNVNNRSESIWDTMAHLKPSKIFDGSNGDVADNSYYLYKTDIDLVKQLEANAYRISISWTRVLPDGTSNYVNKDGIDYYNNVINYMLTKNITPHVTIFHWDLPQKFQDLGGWTNPKIIDWFVDYARVLFQEFGDRVQYWTTFNEPNIFCRLGYNGILAPGLKESGRSDYICGHHALLAHAKTYRMYKEEFYEAQKGAVGIVVSAMLPVAEDATDPEEVEGVKLSWDFRNGWIINPIFSNDGDYPKTMKKRIAEYSAIQGFSQSRLPEFTPEQIQLVKNSADYFGFNFYSAGYFKKIENHNINSSVSADRDVGMTSSSKKFSKDRNTPWAMTESLRRINKDYNVPYFLITENGYWDEGTLDDTDRAQYYLDHLREVSKLINQGFDIRGYFAWSLLDNFEWVFGYMQKYGLFAVNYTDPNRQRTPKFSTKIITKIYKTKTVPSSIYDSNEQSQNKTKNVWSWSWSYSNTSSCFLGFIFTIFLTNKL
ncbi:Similar to LCT: Lactase-phlorizin hydrolase (Oryctolagus cuniculus) [Cotesia congregata]|uniref:Similar to LCT: Lactase-phlorizin hydrolase (Oryctolagus cuniculus) n=1 Tax=Cotesia congregata TaxID=51543 RepID=A0A8J2HLM9_COTCN|nr:Similar to LCT: Lactase-phlorizin hydrolase (Oryctolagus cuniculus) [Cotesia congregata]